MHDQLVSNTVPGYENCHERGGDEAGDDGEGEGFVECEDAVQDGCCCYVHGEFVAWNLVSYRVQNFQI